MVRTATEADRAWAQSRYDLIGFVRSTAEDRLLVAVEHGEPVGVGRIVPIAPGVGELGGIYVEPGHRGRGLAEHIVRTLMAEAEQHTLFCLPFAHLRALYERCGFAPVESAARQPVEPAPADRIPLAIAAKLAWCNATYPDPVLLLRWDR